MVTYKVEAELAKSLRKQLLITNIGSFFGIILTFAFIGAGSIPLAALFGLATAVLTIWSVVAYWKALWKLWEWPGLGLGLAVAIGVVLINMATGFLGNLLSLGFLIYVYVQLGKQSGEPQPPKRETFNG